MSKTVRDASRPSPFLACDVRGPYPGVLNETLLRAIGRALSAEWQEADRILLVGDVRQSTPSLIAALAEGLAGRDLTIAWPVATPLAYHVSQRHNFARTLIVTASHNPPDHNGLKLLNGTRPPSPEDLCRLREASACWLATDDQPGRAPLSPADVFPWERAYGQDLVQLAPAGRALRLVVDPGNGCYCSLASNVLREAGHQVLEINGSRDGAFPGRGPDPTAPGALHALTEAVGRERADFGVAFDGDGDRAVFVDENGVRVPGDALTVLLATEALRRHGSAPVVLDIRTSRLLARLLRDRGAEVIWSYPGHALVRTAMLDRGASFAGELSGHYFFGELGHDDGLYAALRVAVLVASEGPLGGLVGALPRVPGLDEIRVRYEGAAADVYDALESADLGARVERGALGIALTWDRAWALVRPSITEPLLTVRGEADTDDELAQLRARLGAALAAVHISLD